MLRIFDKNYDSLIPTKPRYKALCVFTYEEANMVFKYMSVDFVFVMNENNGTFAKYHSLVEVNEFLNKV